MSSAKMRSKSKGEDGEVVRLKPNQYIHVHDNNSNVTRVVLGPCTFTKQDHEEITELPQMCCVVPPRHYCIIENPVQRGADGSVVKDKHGSAKVRLGDREVRFEQEPFPLYPQEVLVSGAILPLQVLPVNKALKLKASRDVEDKSAGDMWLFVGPGTYLPRVEVEVVCEVSAVIVQALQGLIIKATNSCTDGAGKPRRAGEVWLYKEPGAYMPSVDEVIVETVSAEILTPTLALSMTAVQTFTDIHGKVRQAGSQWLVTSQDSETYIPGPDETIKERVELTILGPQHFCVVCDPIIDGVQKLGQKQLRQGPCTFFLRPGEYLENGIENVYVLSEGHALLLHAEQGFKDGDVARQAGDKWMIYGPTEYVPSVEVKVLEERKAIPLNENEGIYVRDTQTGQVRSELGGTYMLAAHEELWEKKLQPKVEQLLAVQQSSGEKRDLTRVVTYHVPHNSVCQVYDYKSKSPRLIWGPDLVKLGPDEEFTLVSLSGGKPKKPGVIKILVVSLGPDFMTDIITVETSDHARLSLQLAYSWHFDVAPGDMEAAKKVFDVKDFTGDACSAIASRIRGVVAGTSFDTFHKNSSQLIKVAVFGMDKATHQPKDQLTFKQNGLVITSVDVQSVEPVDTKTRDALMKSVQLAIEITTQSQEAAARQEAEMREQSAKSQLEKQVIDDKAKAEKEKMKLLEMQSISAAIKSQGVSKAEAKAVAAAKEIEGQSEVEQAQVKAEAQKIMNAMNFGTEQAAQLAELEHREQMNALEVEKTKGLAEIESNKFKQIVAAIGPETIAAMARAGPEMQAKLLGGLGLQGYLLTDGNSPINLMNAAAGLTGVDPAQ